MSLTTELDRYKRAEFRRIVWQLRFLENIDTSLDKILDPVIEKIYTDAQADIDEKTERPSDHHVFRRLIKSAIEKSADPSTQTAISDSVNRNSGESVGKIIGSQEDADLLVAIDNRTTTPKDITLSSVPIGGFAEAQVSAKDLFDDSRKMQQKVLNSVAAVLSGLPNIIPQMVKTSLQRLVETGNDLVSKFTELNDTVGEIGADCAALDEAYYTGRRDFDRTEDALPYLEEADEKLLTIRLTMIEEAFFKEALYEEAKANIQSASGALVNYGAATNKVVEVKGGIASLDFMMAAIEEAYGVFYSQVNSLIGCYEKIQEEVTSSMKGPMLAMLNHIQAEIRSIFRSMSAAVAKGDTASAPTLERMWYMELLALQKKMDIVPEAIWTYLDEDEDGYVADYVPISYDLAAIAFEEDLALLKNRITYMKYWVGKRLEDGWPNDPDIQTKLNDVISNIQSDNITLVNNIELAITAAESYSSVEIGEIPGHLSELLLSAGMDRANDIMLRADWEEFFSLSPDNASYRGQFSATLSEELDEALNNPDLTVNAVNDLASAKQFVLNQKRADDLLSSIFSRYKTMAQDMLVKEDMAEIQQVSASVERYQAEVDS